MKPIKNILTTLSLAGIILTSSLNSAHAGPIGSAPGPKGTSTATSTGTGKGPVSGTTTKTSTSTSTGKGPSFPTTTKTSTSSQTSTGTGKGPGLPTGTKTGTGTSTHTLPPKPTTPPVAFAPTITVDTISKKNTSGLARAFKNGMFVNFPDGADYRVCGSIKNATDILTTKDGKAFVRVDGREYPLVPAKNGTAGSYTYCGEFSVKPLEQEDDRRRDGKKDDIAAKINELSPIFNPFTVNVRGKNGQQATERFVVINSESRDTDDNVHTDAMEILLNNQGKDGDTFNDWLTHAVNDIVLSNEPNFSEMIGEKINDAVNNQTQMDRMYDAVKSKKGWVAQLMMEVLAETYEFVTDIDGDERMTLKYSGMTIGDSDLEAFTGDETLAEIIVEGELKNVKLKFAFKHYVDSYFCGYSVLEQGTLVINIGAMGLTAEIGGIEMGEGEFAMQLEMSGIYGDDINSWWEGWSSSNTWCDLAWSGMDEADDEIDNHFAKTGGFNPKEDSTSKDIVKAMNKDSDMSLTFVPGADLAALVIDEMEIEVPENLDDTYSQQDGYRTTENNGDYEVYQNHEIGFAMDDDIMNQMVHIMTKSGKLSMTKTITQEGLTLNVVFKEDVAPVVSFEGEEEYALRFDLANAYLSLTDSKTKMVSTYRVDISAVLSMYADGFDKSLNFNLADSGVRFVQLSGPALPDKLLEKVVKSAINQVLEKMEETVNAQITEKTDEAFAKMPIDLCIAIDDIGANGSANYLAGSMDLVWDDEILRSDSCFEMEAPETTSYEGSYTGVYTEEELDAIGSDDDED